MLETLFETHYGVALILWIMAAVAFIAMCFWGVVFEED